MPLNETEKDAAEYNINHVQTEALRKLVPDSGAYLNEVCFLFSSHNVQFIRYLGTNPTGLLG